MPSWFTDAFPSDAELRWASIVTRLLAALVLGGLVSLIYSTTRRRHAAQATDLSQTLLLLAVVIAMITLAIGDSTARAFSLVGALAIVRFRSVVDDPRDTAFVILAVAVGLAVGAGFILVPLIGLPIAATIAWAFSKNVLKAPISTPSCRVSVRTNPDAPVGPIRQVLSTHLDALRPRRIETVKKGTLVELVFAGRLKRDGDGHALVRSLQACPGVADVEVVFAEPTAA
jgi:phosphate/sulfate permease